MKRFLLGLGAFAAISMPTVAKAQYLQVETVDNGIQVRNIWNQPIRVDDIVLRFQNVNMFGANEGAARTISFNVDRTLAPGQRVTEINYEDYKTNAKTELIQWTNRQNVYQQGVRVCFENGYGQNVFVYQGTQGACP